MSEKSQEVFIAAMTELPELDGDQDKMEARFDKANFESSTVDIRDSIGTPEFKETWLVLKDYIQFESEKLQQNFSEQTLYKISEVYDFEFSEKLSLETQYDLDLYYQFLEFLEYNNANFISQVWNFLGPKNLMKLDIEKFCNSNDKKIIKEIDEQIETHPQSKMIDLFLRTYYKEKIIKWFIKNSETFKVEITISILEREG